MLHPNARLTPRGRLELVQLVERGASLRLGVAEFRRDRSESTLGLPMTDVPTRSPDGRPLDTERYAATPVNRGYQLCINE